MSIITKMLKQTAVYWGAPTNTGEPDLSYPSPVEISCRWEEVDGRVLDPLSNDEVDKSTVYVDRDVEVGGYLWLGSLSEAPEDPTTLREAVRITGFQKLPNLRAKEFLRIATVGR